MKTMLYISCLAIVVATAAASSAGAAIDASHPGGTAAPVVGQYAPKGKPPPVGAAAAPGTNAAPGSRAAADTSYFYSTAYQYAVTSGAWGYYTIWKPVVAANDSHSLAELAVQSGDRSQIVEVGWTVDHGLNGDGAPHLFVFHWVDSVPACYNGCGFVPYNNPAGYKAGMTLPIGATPLQFTIRHYGTNWWIGYKEGWVGYFPDSLWTGRFTQTGVVQWFGEVAARTPPCTDMGNSAYATAATAARIQDIGFWPAPAPAVTPAPAISTLNTHPAYYTALGTDSTTVRYGGPGAC